MTPSSKRRPKRGYVARITERRDGKQRVLWYGGYFPTMRERNRAVTLAHEERSWETRPISEMTGDGVVDAYLEDYERRGRKASSLDTVEFALRAFRSAFGERVFTSITRAEAKEWADTVPASYVRRTISLGNYAVDELELVQRNPFRGLAAGRRTRGRADRPLPDLEAVLDACAALGGYAPQMRALILTGALTGMRPGELYELRWGDCDLDRNRLTVSRRLYRGVVDTPKNGRAKVIALAPRARDALLALRADRATVVDSSLTHDDAPVFLSKMGEQLSAQLLCLYWKQVRVAANLGPEVDFYLATKHFGVNLLWKEGVSTRAIATQLGWSEHAVDDLLNVYGHKDIAALEEIDALYENGRVTHG